MYAQIIDDTVGNYSGCGFHSSEDVKADLRNNNVEAAACLGKGNCRESKRKRVLQKLYSTEAASFIRVRSKHWQTQQEKPG